MNFKLNGDIRVDFIASATNTKEHWSY